jgi:hypothetical protein
LNAAIEVEGDDAGRGAQGVGRFGRADDVGAAVQKSLNGADVGPPAVLAGGRVDADESDVQVGGVSAVAVGFSGGLAEDRMGQVEAQLSTEDRRAAGPEGAAGLGVEPGRDGQIPRS